MLENFDPTTIQDLSLRQLVLFLLNRDEQHVAEIAQLKAQIQLLRDEVARLRGEQGKPDIKPNLKNKSPNISSEKERRTKKPRPPKTQRAHYQTITRTHSLHLAKESLPTDAVSKGWEEIIVRELRFERETICFRREKYYSPSHKRTYLAALPAGFDGSAFGAGVRSLVISLYYEGGCTQPKIARLLHELGCPVSTGLLASWLTGCNEFAQERRQVERAGLASSEWQGIDDTSTRVNGVNRVCQSLTNPLYTSYHTVAHKDRHSVLKVLCGGELHYRYNEEARALLEMWKLPKRYLGRLEREWPPDTNLFPDQTQAWINKHLPQLGSQQVSLVWNALGIAYYHWQSDWPIVSLLVCDDAPQWEWLTAEMSLCWIHQARHYKKLTPNTPYFKQELERLTAKLWSYYHQLLAYQLDPKPIRVR